MSLDSAHLETLAVHGGSRMRALLSPAWQHAIGHLPPRRSLQLQFLRRMGYWPDLTHPKTFSEKIQHRKLHGVSPLFRQLADKLRVKAWVGAVLGERYVVPTLWSGPAVSAAALSAIPRPFVLKVNHSSGRNIFVPRAGPVDWPAIARRCAAWLALDHLRHDHERWYNEIDRQALAEPLIEGHGPELSDYKFFTFDGEVRVIQADIQRSTNWRRAFFDPSWTRLPAALNYEILDVAIPRPAHLEEMIACAERLAAPFDFVRIDLYDTPDGPRFGEFTFSPESGFSRAITPDYDRRMGAMWTLRPSGAGRPAPRSRLPAWGA